MITYCPECKKRALYQTDKFVECQECGYYRATQPDNLERTKDGDEAKRD